MNSKKQESNWKLIGESEHIHHLKAEIEYVAKKIKIIDMAVLIIGPSGSGKEIIAEEIAKKAGRDLISINCGAIPAELFESEIFGYVKGAFTGATKDKPGLVNSAENGILFLDEIGDLLPYHQAKLLRFLQDKTYYPVGGTRPKKVDNLRVIAASNKELGDEVSKGNFRKDLFYRLNHRVIQTIALKDRRADIICLVNHFVHKTKVNIDSKVKVLLYSYEFPGNVRELESLIYSSDDFQYIKNALRKIVASSIGIPVEFISGFESLKDYESYSIRTISDMYRKRDGDELEGELLFRKKLSEKADAYEFFRATFFAEENECSKMVEAYEILTLRLCPELPKDHIAQILHTANEKTYEKSFEETFGFGFSQEDGMINYSYSTPMKIYPNFSIYWEHKKLHSS